MNFVSYTEVIEGLHERLLTIPGFPKYNPAGQLINLLNYEPKVVQQTPLIYTLLIGFERGKLGQLTSMRYRILHRLLLQWQDNEQSEVQLISLLHAVPAAIDEDPTLGARVEVGNGAHVADAEAGFITISGTKFRCVDFIARVGTKAPFQSGI